MERGQGWGEAVSEEGPSIPYQGWPRTLLLGAKGLQARPLCEGSVRWSSNGLRPELGGVTSPGGSLPPQLQGQTPWEALTFPLSTP